MNTKSSHTVEHLLEECRNGDTQAQFRLYQMYARAMLNTCFRIVNHREEAEDILQEAFLKAFTNLSRFKGNSTFGTWLKRIVVNQAINALKKKKLICLQLDEVGEEQEEKQETVPDWVPETVHQAYKALHQLPAGYRTVFSLYALEGYDHEEIGEILGISSSTSVSQYSRAKRKLREIIKQTSPHGQARKMV